MNDLVREIDSLSDIEVIRTETVKKPGEGRRALALAAFVAKHFK